MPRTDIHPSIPTYYRHLCLAAGLLLASSVTMAMDQACHIKNRIALPSALVVVLDQCIEYRIPMTAAFEKEFRASCNTAAESLDKKGTVQFMQSCPLAARGTCDGVMGAPVRMAFYNTDVNELAEEKKRCTGADGIWSP